MTVAWHPEIASPRALYLQAEALERVGDHRAAVRCWGEAYDRCRISGLDDAALLCLARQMSPLRHTGRWERVVRVGRNLLRHPAMPEPARMVAGTDLGLVLASRGRTAPARPLLARAATFAEAYGIDRLWVDASWGLARADAMDGSAAAATARLNELTARCVEAVPTGAGPAVRWAASFFARRGRGVDVARCVEVLRRVEARSPAVDTSAALACAVGEQLLLGGRPHEAADHFEHGLAILRAAGLLGEHVEVLVRTGAALAAAGERQRAAQHLSRGRDAARRLRAQPLAGVAANELGLLNAPAWPAANAA